MLAHSRRATFENYSFHIPPKLLFEKDGDARCGEYLFIYDSQEKYLISFETGMPCFDLQLRDNRRYCSEECAYKHMKIRFCYPESRKESCGCMVYFHAELPVPSGGTYILPGQMKLSAGNEWSAEARNVLVELLEGVAVNTIPSAC